MNFRLLTPFFDPAVQEWSLPARLLRWLTFLWLFVGLIILFSASYASASADFNDGIYYVKRQIAWILLGLVGFNVVVTVPIRRVVALAQWGLLICLALILVTLIPGLGTTVNGSTRWISLGLFPLQPSELIKPFLVLQAAYVFGQWIRLSWTVRLTWLSIFTLTLVAVLSQPNLSTAALCGMSLWLIALAAGLPYLYLISTALVGSVMLVVSLGTREYQRRRILSFWNPWADPHGDGYQLIQSLLAIGSGKLFGIGFGESQQKLIYLPIHHTDFIFAVFAEEFGFVGCLLLLLFLVIYSTLGLWVALKAKWQVHRLVAIGSVIILVGQALLNIGVAVGVLPTTGLPFPMFSYGGSSMISSLLIAGLIVRVAREGSEATITPLMTAIGKHPKPMP
jgi:cell division protein FtsW